MMKLTQLYVCYGIVSGCFALTVAIMFFAIAITVLQFVG